MDLRKLLSQNNYIIVNKELAKKIGLDEAIMLGELCNESIYWEERNLLEDGYFYSTIENIENSITFNPKKQKRVLDHLIEIKLIAVKLKGVPAKRYIKILVDGLSQFVQNDQTSLVKNAKLDWQKIPNKFSQNDQQILIITNNKNNNKNINNNKRPSTSSNPNDELNRKLGFATIEDINPNITY
ncbi:MAG: hypothetical protein MJ060_03690 [Clostridia bacterium]|nr:hypothetical protein [Clostridia bacterium]